MVTSPSSRRKHLPVLQSLAPIFGELARSLQEETLGRFNLVPEQQERVIGGRNATPRECNQKAASSLHLRRGTHGMVSRLACDGKAAVDWFSRGRSHHPCWYSSSNTSHPPPY